MAFHKIKWLFISVLVLFAMFFRLFYKLPTPQLFSPPSTYKHQQFESLKQVDPRIVDRALKIEDKRFYQHHGVDLLAISRAVVADFKALKFAQWASTIDQQVIKLASQKFGNRSLSTKLEEILKAWKLNNAYTKDQILLRWINNVYFSHWIQGFESACNIYFGKDCKELFDSQLLFLFAIYQTWKSPISHFDLLKQRSLQLCRKLDLDCQNFDNLPPQTLQDLAFDFKKLDIVDLTPSKHKSKLNINPHWQTQISEIISNTKDFRRQMNMEDCCVMILDQTGNIKAMQTCRWPWDEQKSSWINWCFVPRQVGSAIKPFVYLKWMIDFGRDSKTIFDDEPFEVVDINGNVYAPKNFDLKYHGKVPLSIALGSSLNVPAVKALNQIGVENFLSFLRQLRVALGDDVKNISPDIADRLGLSVALGTYEMSVWEFTNLWRTFLVGEVWGGFWRGLRRERSEEGSEEVWREFVLGRSEEVKRSGKVWRDDVGRLELIQKVAEIVDILADNKNRLLSFGLDNNLDVHWWSGKTWTSRHFVDGRTCGINLSKKIVLCVWAGNYDQRPMKGSWIQTAGFLRNLIANKIK